MFGIEFTKPKSTYEASEARLEKKNNCLVKYFKSTFNRQKAQNNGLAKVGKGSFPSTALSNEKAHHSSWFMKILS
jgi:hypothetical protein